MIGNLDLLTAVHALGIEGHICPLLKGSKGRRQKKWQAMLSTLKNGDKVVTSGGIRGTIISVKDDAVQLRVPPDGLRIEVARASVTALVNPEEAK